MRALSILISSLVIMSPIGAVAGSMPVLPDLPPLPTDYVSVSNGGFYAGVLSGMTIRSTNQLGAALVIGNTVDAGDWLWGYEGIAHLALPGAGISVEAALRGGFRLTDTVSAFGNVGIGQSFQTGAFLSLGPSLEAEFGGSWLVRADYRYNHDLSGDPVQHKVMGGLLRSF